MRLSTLILMILLGSVAAPALANGDIGSDMGTIAENYATVQQTQSLDEFKTALQNIRVAALDAEQGTPTRLAGQQADSPSMVDFRHGLTLLVANVDQALALANKGDLSQAQASAEKMKAIRNEYHQKYR
ncbi:cytochrome b562 [Rouxiella sp. Mn2063]|uniref:cytochrome b562 n=1 Tax=Rouxiella sp. Mn2063 TaxID=3395262 RepID=UPI003BC9778C